MKQFNNMREAALQGMAYCAEHEGMAIMVVCTPQGIAVRGQYLGKVHTIMEAYETLDQANLNPLLSNVHRVYNEITKADIEGNA